MIMFLLLHFFYHNTLKENTLCSLTKFHKNNYFLSEYNFGMDATRTSHVISTGKDKNWRPIPIMKSEIPT